MREKCSNGDYSIVVQLLNGQVFKCISHETGFEHAIKVVPFRNMAFTPNGTVCDLLKEVEFLKAVKHPHVVSFIDIFSDHENLYIISEFVEGLFNFFFKCWILILMLTA